jgi:hypothetical protein
MSRRAVSCEDLASFARRVQHHFDHAFHILIEVFQPADVHSQAASDRGTDLLGIEVLSLNFAALQYIFGVEFV